MSRERAARPSGFLAEYDALKDIGHACGHHMQGPSVIGAAMALRDLCKDQPYKIVIYGTPAEETIGRKDHYEGERVFSGYRPCAHDACSPQYLCRCPLYGT